MENYPAVVRCEDVYVAVPIRTLAQQSTVFQSAFHVNEKRPKKKADSAQENHDTNTTEAFDDLSEKNIDKEKRGTSEEKSADKMQTDDDAEKNENVDIDCEDNVNTPKNADTDDKTTIDDAEMSGEEKKQDAVEKPEGLASSEEKDVELEKTDDKIIETEGQADIILIKGFNKESVRIVFGHLAGYTEKLEQCSDFMILSDMLLLCHKYSIKNLVDKIIARVENSSINIDNLVAAVEAAERLEEVADFESTSEDLYQRCLGYARSNLASWQVLINFILNNKSRKGHVVKLCEALKNDSNVTIRRRVENVSKLAEEGPSYVVKNLRWRIVCKKNQANELGLFVEVENPNGSSSWSCNASVQLSLVNQDTGAHFFQHFNHKFGAGAETEGFQSFMNWGQVVNGYIKDNTLLVEAKITVLSVSGVQETLGKAEKDIGWFHDPMDVPEFEEDYFNIESDQDELEKDLLVILRCEKVSVSVQQSTLMAQSKYFKARLSRNWSKYSLTSLVEEDEKEFSLTRTINISGYNPTAVKTLFDHIEGYPQMMRECQAFDVLGDMLLLCDYYIIPEPVKIILDKMENTPVTANNLVTVFETGKKLEINERLKHVADVLIRRSLTYAGANLASWQSVLSFIVNHRDNVDSVVKICELLGEEENYVIRSRIERVSRLILNVGKDSCSFMCANLIWNIQVKKLNPNDEAKWLGVFLLCKTEDDSLKWSCQLESFKYIVHNYTNDQPCEKELSSVEMNNGNPGWGYDKGKYWSEIMNSKNGFVKNDSIRVEIKFRVKSTSGIPTSLGIPETMIR